MYLFYVIAAFLAFAVAPSAANRKRCDQLPTDIKCDARVQVEPYGKNVILYRSTEPQERCLNMSYVGNRNNNTQQGTYIAWDSEDKYHIATKVDVNADMSNWTLTNDSDAFCGVLDDKGKKELDEELAQNFPDKDLPLIVLNDKGKEELDAELAKNFPDKDLPLMDGQTLGVVYDKNCKTRSS